MDFKPIAHCPRMLIAFLALAAGVDSAAGTDSMGDYRSFSFSAANPYFTQGGKVDFGTYNGFRRYHSECHVCHGPGGGGSSYAPSLLESVRALSFHEFVDVTVRGRSTQANFVMPGFAENMNVLPYLHDLYAYLKARADGVIGPARPQRFPKVRIAGMGGMPMGGMPMGGVPMGGMRMGGVPMGGMRMGGGSGMKGAYTKGPDGSVYLFPAGKGGMTGMGGQNR